MLSPAPIRPACIPESFVSIGRCTARWPVASPSSTNLAAGEFCVLSSGLLAAPALSSDNITNANVLAALTNEPYRSSLYAADSVPVRQLNVSVALLLPTTLIEVNFYDAVSTPNHALRRDIVGTNIAVSRIGGIYYGRFLSSYTGLATFTVVDLVDPVGTIYGRILIKPTASYRLF